MKEGDIELLKQIAEYEATLDWSVPGMDLGWCFRDVRISPAILNRFFLEGYLDNPFRSNSYTGYKLSEKGKAVLELGDIIEVSEVPVPVLEIPEDLFDIIEGYDDIKGLIRQVLESDKPVHMLFTGVPSSAKTMFLLELSRTGAPYVLGSQATKAGIASLLFDAEPQILLVDEIDRIGTKDIAVLLSLMQTGIVAETKWGKRRDIKLATKVFAASNTLKLPPELISRFMVLQFKPYSKSDFLLVATNLLRKRENIDGDLATYIAERVWDMSQRFPDPRQAVRIARIAKTKEKVDEVIQILSRYSDVR